MTKNYTSIVINIYSNNQDSDVSGNTSIVPLAVEKPATSTKLTKMENLQSVIKTLQVIAPSVPAIIDFLKKAA